MSQRTRAAGIESRQMKVRLSAKQLAQVRRVPAVGCRPLLQRACRGARSRRVAILLILLQRRWWWVHPVQPVRRHRGRPRGEIRSIGRKVVLHQAGVQSVVCRCRQQMPHSQAKRQCRSDVHSSVRTQICMKQGGLTCNAGSRDGRSISSIREAPARPAAMPAQPQPAPSSTTMRPATQLRCCRKGSVKL